MKKSSLLALVCLASAQLSSGQTPDLIDKSNNRFYFSLSSGYGISSDLRSKTHKKHFIRYKPGYAFGATLGYSFNKVRFEIASDYYDLELKSIFAKGEPQKRTDGHFNTFALMGNLLFDIPLSEKLDWAMGAGLGWARVKNKARLDDGAILYDESRHLLTYQIISGPVYKINDNWAISVQYSLLSHPKFKSKIELNKKYTKFKSNYTHALKLGIRYSL